MSRNYSTRTSNLLQYSSTLQMERNDKNKKSQSNSVTSHLHSINFSKCIIQSNFFYFLMKITNLIK